MAKVGKKYAEAVKLIEAGKFYEPVEAIELVKKTATANFDETVEIAFNLNVDPKYADQQVRGAVVLPHGTGKTKRVLVFAKGDNIKAAEEAGADFVGSEELVAKIQGGWSDFDVVVATPDMMGQVGRLGKILGPKGLMPNPKVGTVTPDVARCSKRNQSMVKSNTVLIKQVLSLAPSVKRLSMMKNYLTTTVQSLILLSRLNL